MKRITSALLSAILLFTLPACDSISYAKPTFSDTPIDELRDLAGELTDYMNEGDEDAALAIMDATMQSVMKGKVAEVWDSAAKSLGAFLEVTDYIGFQSDGYNIIEMTLVFQNGTQIQRTVFDKNDRVAGLFFRAGAVEATPVPLPSGVTEEAVSVDAGVGYPLDGLLTLPSGEAKAAVLLIHGSGPADKDETIAVNKPFRDIAYALAAKGVAVLRYDKRTFTYGAKLAADADSLAKLTVYDETIDDAVAAAKLLKSRFDKVYLLGHSMSGGLLAEMNVRGANADGYIVMAGTTRKLYDLSAEQNLRYADELEANGDFSGAKEIDDLVDNELAKSGRIADLSDEEALSEDNTVFGMSAWYLRDFERINTTQLHLKDGKPLLVLQGGRDRQVTEKDFQLWQSGLAAHPNAAFRLYPNLNHIMGDYQGEAVPFSELVSREYGQSTPVAANVTDDIYEWVTGLRG
ncbi:MAG: alpha/beta fold hydrolase [Oscillospiraceae bacterium]|jgi:dienelactone hydrolase|nr:alpha/beta fold hydrolase [Oscillospiraceae bacterium]